jgi:hypothetical protein
VTLEDVGIIGELIAAVATIAMLAYLAIQIRASVTATRAEGRREMDSVGIEMVARIAENPELASLFMQGLSQPDSLSPDQRFRFTLSLSFFFSQHETAWIEAQQGTLAPDELDKQFERLKQFMISPGGIAWWREYSSMYSREFHDYLNSRLQPVK